MNIINPDIAVVAPAVPPALAPAVPPAVAPAVAPARILIQDNQVAALWQFFTVKQLENWDKAIKRARITAFLKMDIYKNLHRSHFRTQMSKYLTKKGRNKHCGMLFRDATKEMMDDSKFAGASILAVLHKVHMVFTISPMNAVPPKVQSFFKLFKLFGQTARQFRCIACRPLFWTYQM